MSTIGGFRRSPRAPHPVVVLRWLRAGALVMVAVTGLLYLVVSNQAEEQISAAQRTDKALKAIGDARDEAQNAEDALMAAAGTGEVNLIGTGAKFANATSRVSTLVTSAAEGNAAGKRGLNHIQFVQGQLATCVQLANTAVRDGKEDLTAAREALRDAREEYGNEQVPFTGGLKNSLEDLETLQTEALDERLVTGWLNTAVLWPLLVGPAVVMLVLVGATGAIVTRHFRRYPSPALLLALLATAAVGIATCVLCEVDRTELSDPLMPGDDRVMASALGLLTAAAVLTYLAYRPRLAEYRFPRT